MLIAAMQSTHTFHGAYVQRTLRLPFKICVPQNSLFIIIKSRSKEFLGVIVGIEEDIQRWPSQMLRDTRLNKA